MPLVSVIGSGALGKFYGALFAFSGCDVCHLERSDFTTIQEKQYYTLELPDGRIIQVKPYQIEKDFRLLPKSDLIIIALKTTENHLLPKLLPPTLKQGSKILLLQNGIGNEEYLFNFIKNHPIICAVTTISASRIKPGYIKIKHTGELKLASFAQQDKASCEQIKQQLLSTPRANVLCQEIQLFENHRVLRWTKLLWNTAFSSLSLLCNLPADVLASQQPYQSIVRTIMYEVCLVARKDGAQLEENIEKLIDLTATLKGLYPSMYYDFKMGKPIESQYIVYNVIDCANSHDLNLPSLSVVYEKLLLLVDRDEWFSPSEQNAIISLLKPHTLIPKPTPGINNTTDHPVPKL